MENNFTLSKKTILLTGGTGSFGHAFVEKVLTKFDNVTIRIFSRDELKQHEMRQKFGEEHVRYMIGDVRDRYRLRRAIEGVDVVIHAAAMKQVPACEYNPFEAVQTNIIGAQNVVDAAIDRHVPQVIGISTDKAVNPVNLYGATKLCAEKIMIQGNAYAARSNTKISCVRYGNVIGSRGSVVPIFKQQKSEGVITITDERMTRFWITLDQAIELVLFSLEHQVGGEVFIPKIPSVKVVDLAQAIAPDAQIKVVGVRPGEKIHELLITSDESRHTVDVGSNFVILPEHPWFDDSKWRTGTKVKNNFIYSSDGNDNWLTHEELSRILI